MTEPMSPAEIGRLGRSAVDKVDQYGKRGLTLLSMQEIEALVMIAVLSGLLPAPGLQADLETNPKFKSRRTASV